MEVVTGILAVISALIVLFYPGLGADFLIVLLSVGLLFVGMRSIFVAGIGHISNGLKALSVISGVIALVFSLVILIYPNYGAAGLVVLFSYALMFYGITRLVLSYELKASYTWVRAMIATVGVIDIILGAIVLAYPDVALLTLVFLLGAGLFVMGAEMIASGVYGRTWLGEMVEASGGPKPA
ncbi:MAG TPA: DUF308 domain-containing protein [Conexivisphaerales archaeon]|nr:DUF308 domain-containing protein [Conexivisphaerales archaeon]